MEGMDGVLEQAFFVDSLVGDLVESVCFAKGNNNGAGSVRVREQTKEEG